MESLLAEINPVINSLLAPVHVAESGNTVLRSDHPAADILAQPGLVVVHRQLETANTFLGLEQATRYVLLDPRGTHIGYMAEHDGTHQEISSGQWFRTHRAFTTHIFDRKSQEVLRFHRPFSWSSTRLGVYDAANSRFNPTTKNPQLQQDLSGPPIDTMAMIGEVRSRWAPRRGSYDLLVSRAPKPSQPGSASTKHVEDLAATQDKETKQESKTSALTQFASINEHSKSWDFSLSSTDGQEIGSINRRFRGFAQQHFTHTGSYVFHMDSVGLKRDLQENDLTAERGKSDQANVEVLLGKEFKKGLTLDQRAVMLASAVTINFDYLSGYRSGDQNDTLLWVLPLPNPSHSNGVGRAGDVGIVGGGGGAGHVVGGGVGGFGSGHGAIAGAGSLAGYDAMHRGMEQGSSPENPATSRQSSPFDPEPSQTPGSQQQQGDVWGQGDADPWSNTGAPSGGGGVGGEGGGGGWFDWIWDIFH